MFFDFWAAMTVLLITERGVVSSTFNTPAEEEAIRSLYFLFLIFFLMSKLKEFEEREEQTPRHDTIEQIGPQSYVEAPQTLRGVDKLRRSVYFS